MFFNRKRREEDILKGFVSGFVGGLVGSLVMNQFQAVWNGLAEKLDANATNKENKNGQGDQKSASVTEEEDPATVKAATAVSEGVFHHKLTKREETVAGEAVHYAVGATSGAIYGAIAELAPETTIGAGAPFGTAVWLVVDEGMVPALGLAKAPTQYPLSVHAYALASHLVYGVATDVARRKIRELL